MLTLTCSIYEWDYFIVSLLQMRVFMSFCVDFQEIKLCLRTNFSFMELLWHSQNTRSTIFFTNYNYLTNKMSNSI